MPKLRHIAIAAEDPEAMAEFYKKAFDFVEVGRPNGVLADGVFLSDGTLNVAILKFKSDQLGKGMDYRGLHHFGVLVEDVDEFTKKLESLGGGHYIGLHRVGILVEDIDKSAKKVEALGGSHYMDQSDPDRTGGFEVKLYGPEGVLFDVAEHPWTGTEPLPVKEKVAAE